MTTELEKQFFDTFGIEPKYYCSYHDCNCPIEDVDKFNKKCPKQAVTKECDVRSHKALYPQITDRILLELFDILRTSYNIDFWSIDGTFVMDLRDKQASYTNIFYRTGGDLKTSILNSLNLVVKQNFIDKDTIKHQVQAIFEGER